jgi:mRNA interferase YafQ
MLRPIFERSFKKDYEKSKRRGLNIAKLKSIVDDLVNERPLGAKHKNHKLKGEFVDYWECHIEPDWLLIYRKDELNVYIYFVRNGTHSDLFR